MGTHGSAEKQEHKWPDEGAVLRDDGLEILPGAVAAVLRISCVPLCATAVNTRRGGPTHTLDTAIMAHERHDTVQRVWCVRCVVCCGLDAWEAVIILQVT